MIFKPYYYFETGCAAYLFGCGGLGKCAVVDAHEEDVDAYLALAASKDMRITHVIDTHVHADHRSGGPALAKKADADYCLHESANVALPFEPLHDGQEIELGKTRVKLLHTPGHTPESISLVVTDLRRGADPWFVLTGDTLFVGAVGRPDLPGRARENAGELYDSIHAKLLTLPDDLEVYPGHFSGSVCGAGMSGKPSSTIAFEKRWNPLLAKSRDEFVKIDLAGPQKRGLAMGLNEFAGYFAVAGSALATGFVAAQYGLRPEPFYLGVAFVALGLFLSVVVVRETKHHVAAESKLHGELPPEGMPTQREVFWRTSLLDKNLSSVSQAGLVNNLNDGMAWGLFPLFFAAAQMELGQIGTLAAIYPATWGIAQIFTGAWSDRVGRKWLIASGMWVQALGIVVIVLSSAFAPFATGAALLGVGTAMVYPTLLTAAERACELPHGAVVVTVCGKGGGRSERAAEHLRASGFASARSLCGGAQAWMQLAAQGA